MHLKFASAISDEVSSSLLNPEIPTNLFWKFQKNKDIRDNVSLAEGKKQFDKAL